MIAPQEALRRMQAADPVPTLAAVPETLVASVWARVDEQLSTAVGSQRPASPVLETGRPRSWGRPAFVVTLVFVATVAVVGAVSLLRTQGAPVSTATTSVVATTIPEPTLPATTVPVAPVSTTESVTTTMATPDKPALLEISWQRVPEQAALEDGWISAVTPGGPGYVAVGGTVGCSDPLSPNCRLDAAVWMSADGLVWERIESDSFRSHAVRSVAHGEPIDGDQFMNDVTVGPTGFVAVGAAPVIDPDRGSGYLDRVGIWLSSDGRQWDRLPYDDEVFSGFAELRRVASFNDRLVAIGGPTAAAFVSTDGSSWQRVAIDPSVEAEVLDLTVWDGGLVAVGSVAERPAVWASEDGVSWTSVDDRGLMESAGNLQGVSGGSGGLVALGTSFPSARVAAWRSGAGTGWTVAPRWVGTDQEWQYTSRTGLSVARVAGGLETDVVLINGSSSLWGTADGGEWWYSVGDFDGGDLNELGSSASAAFNTVNQVLAIDDRLLAVGKVVAWSSTEPIGGLCYVDPGDGSLGSCRADAAIWVGTWDNAP